MRRLDDCYPDVSPNLESGYLEEENGHQVYYSVAGNPEGIPVIFCHGGPGGSCSPQYQRLVDSSLFLVVMFDQRGCGKSTPKGLLEHNSLEHSIHDMERIRKHLDIESWAVLGGSWGSTLALAYAEEYPERTRGLLLVSLWLCRKADIDWWFQGVRTIFPELWDQFASLAPESRRNDLKNFYCEAVLGDDAELAAEAGRRLYLYEEGFMRFDAPLAPPDESRGPDYARIFAHYAANDFFLEEQQLLVNAKQIEGIPTILVTGRYDMCTTPNNAYDLAQLLPDAKLRLISAAGHYPTEKALSLACVEAGYDLYHMLSKN